MNKDSWERRLAVAWSSLDDVGGAEFVELIGSLAAELPPVVPAPTSSRRARSTRPAIQRRQCRCTRRRSRRATVSPTSSAAGLSFKWPAPCGTSAGPTRACGCCGTELARGSDHLDDAVRATLALALTDLGQTREAVSIAVGALARHLPRYQRSMAAYAQMLMEPEPPAPTR